MVIAQLAQTCEHGNCSNAARYIAIDGRGLCGIHAIGVRALRILDIPAALVAIAEVVDELEGTPIMRADVEQLRGLIGRRTE